MIYPSDITPLSEYEELNHYPSIRCQVKKGVNTPYFKWICLCGETCCITFDALIRGALGGICRCSRAYRVNILDVNVTRIAM